MTLVDPGKTEFWHARTPFNRTCLHCGKAFITRLHGKKTCSPECSRLHRLDYGRQWRADNPIPKKGRRRVLPAVLGHAASLARQGVFVRFDLRSGDLFSWFHATCEQYGCSMSELVRAAIRCTLTGDVTITPRPEPKRPRQLQIYIPIEDAIALLAESEKHGDTSQAAVLRRALWRLKAVLDPTASC